VIVFRARACLRLSIAMIAASAIGLDVGLTDRPTAIFSAAPAAAETDGDALLSRLDTTMRERRRAGDLTAAAALGRQAWRVAVAEFGPTSAATTQRLVLLAQTHIDRRRWLDAEPLLILAARQARDADNAGLGAAALAGLARVALARGDADAALAWAEQAVQAMRRNPHHGTCEPLRAHGAALAMRERFADALRALEEALACDRLGHGLEASETARSLSQLGNLYLRWRRPEAALPLLQEAAAIDQARLGPPHPFIADDLHDIGLAYETLDRPEQARLLYLAALAVLERGGTETSRDTPRRAYVELALGRVERRLGRDAAAEASERDASRILSAARKEERRRERRA
jgi:tetratricopeptide (TPR) repeat protein